jgi:TonB-linked SusC/RagA family outer membrane protein
MKITYYIISIMAGLFLSCFPAVAQQPSVRAGQTYELTVKDHLGNPLKGASVYVNEGAAVVRTDESGKASVIVTSNMDILVEAKGYASRVLTYAQYNDSGEVSLEQLPLFLSEDDDVNIAFGQVKELEMLGSATVIKGDELMKYDLSLTLEQALLGRVPGLYSMRRGTLTEFNKGPIAFRGHDNSQNTLVIVDGLPRTWETISLSEIEQVAFLKDVHASVLFGSEAANGVLMITTKRGKAYKQNIDVYAYYGFETPKALPKYLSSADYMELYNVARANDGLEPQFNEIDNYRSGNPYRYPSIDYYSNDYLRSAAPFSNIFTQISGGNKIASYFANLGWERSGDLVKVGTAKDIANNAFKARGNVDLRVNSWITTSIDAFARFENNGIDEYSRTLIGNYWIQAAQLRPDLYSPLIPIELVDENDSQLQAVKNIVDGQYLLGGNASNLTGPIARLYSGGDVTVNQRWFQFNNRINFDLDWILKGLSLKTNFSFDFWTNYQQATPNTFAVYEPVWGASDQIVRLTKHGEDNRQGTQNVSTGFFERRFGFTGQLDYNRIFGQHQVDASLIAYGTRRSQTNQYQGDKYAHLGLRLSYTYDHRYMVDFNGACINSVKLPDGHRLGASPSLGLGWIISSEDFLASADAVDLLKLRISGGILHTDLGFTNNWYERGNGGFYWYDDVFGGSGSYNWNDGSNSRSGTVASYGANRSLGFEKRKDVNIGIDGLFFNGMIGLNGDIFIQRYSDKVVRVYNSYPGYYNTFVPYNNYDEDAYRGFEIGATFNRRFSDFSVMLNANLLYVTSEVIKKDEIYSYDYLYRAGKSTDAIFGLEALGFFKDEADIAGSAYQTYGTVRPGDIKYKDQNGDGLIDNTDQIQIGRSHAPLSYGLNLLLGYKGFSLYVSGLGRSGADAYIPNNGYFRPRAQQKYSEYIIDKHWTPATAATATLPRLTTTDAVNNNQNSTFWLFRNDYLNLGKVQLTYNFPEEAFRSLPMKGLALYLRGTDLLTLSEYNEIRDLNIGGRPYMRSFSLGLNVSF